MVRIVIFCHLVGIESSSKIQQTMKLFQFHLNLFQVMGIVPLHPNQNYSLNLKSIFIFLTISFYLIFSIAFVMFEAQSAEEYGDSIYMSIGNLASLVSFSITIWKISHMLILIRKFEEMIEKSKSHVIFNRSE